MFVFIIELGGMETEELLREVMYLSKDTQELASNMLRIDPSSDVVRVIGFSQQ